MTALHTPINHVPCLRNTTYCMGLSPSLHPTEWEPWSVVRVRGAKGVCRNRFCCFPTRFYWPENKKWKKNTEEKNGKHVLFRSELASLRVQSYHSACISWANQKPHILYGLLYIDRMGTREWECTARQVDVPKKFQLRENLFERLFQTKYQRNFKIHVPRKLPE